MPRGEGNVHKLAVWFWDEILDHGKAVLGESVSFWSAPRRWTSRYLGEAKKAYQDELDIDILKSALLRMKQSGESPMDILVATRWRAKDGNLLYDAMLKESNTPPPIYEPHAFRAWAIAHGREDLLELL